MPLHAPVPNSILSNPHDLTSLDFIRLNLIPIFFFVVGFLSLTWMIGFNVFLSRQMVMRFFRSLGVSTPRTQRAFQELKRKSFHLAGLLIPFIYYLGLHYSNGLITRTRGLILLGAVTTFLWIVELLRYISPSFRGHYNRLFRSIMRKQELLADSAANLDTQEGSLAHTVDQIVQSITTPLLGELPPSPRSHNHNDHATMPHLRSSAASASSSSSSVAINAASQFASPRDYDRLAKTGLSSQQISSLAPPVTSEKIFTGTGFFFLGCFLSMIFFEPTIATCSMFFLVLGDMTAAIVGISFGSIKIGKKSLEGTVAMFAVCFTIGSIFFFNVTGSSSIVFIAALTATLVELLGPEKWWADDNITIPLSTGMAFTAAFQIVSGGVPTTMIESF